MTLQAWPIPGSDRTVLVPARFINGEVQPLRRDEILKLGVNRRMILASAPKAAEEVLATLTLRYVRDRNQVIQFAVLESDSPLTASAVLARGASAVPAVIAEIHANTIRGLRDEGHEVAAHGFKHEDVSRLTREEEHARLERTTAILDKVAGRRPSGWFSLPLARPASHGFRSSGLSSSMQWV